MLDLIGLVPQTGRELMLGSAMNCRRYRGKPEIADLDGEVENLERRLFEMRDAIDRHYHKMFELQRQERKLKGQLRC